MISSKTKQKILNLTSDCKLYSRLFITCQSQEGNLKNVFAYENYSFPVVISEHGKLRKCIQVRLSQVSVRNWRIICRVTKTLYKSDRWSSFCLYECSKMCKNNWRLLYGAWRKAFEIANDVQHTDFVFDV